MWIVYLLITIALLPIAAVLGLYGFVRFQRRREISLAHQAHYPETDPLLAELDANQAALLYFTSENCAPCKTMQTPAINALKQQMPDLQVIMIDVMAEPELAARWQVMSLPRTFVIGKNRHVHSTNFDVADTPTLKAQLETAMLSNAETVTVNVLTEKQGFRLPRIKFTASSDNT